MSNVVDMLDYVHKRRSVMQEAVIWSAMDKKEIDKYLKYQNLAIKLETHYNYMSNQYLEYWLSGIVKEMPEFVHGGL